MQEPSPGAPSTLEPASAAAPAPGDRSEAIVLFGTRVSRDTVIYVAGTAAVLPFGLVTIAVLTRYLRPAEYGELAVLFVFAGLLTTVYNLGSLQGVFMWVFGSSGEEEAVESGSGAAAGQKREALGTGFIFTLGILGAATLPVMVLAGPIGGLLLGAGDHSTAIRWTAASAAFGAVWRLVVNLFRMERRPVTFAVLNCLRPTFVLACSIPLVATGHGVVGAVAGTALGTAIASLICLVLARRSYRLVFRPDDARQILRRGSRYIPVILGLWVAHNADVFVLSRFASDADVGLYRLAGRVAVFVSYFVSAFLMAWAPLEATSLFRGAYERLGRNLVRAKLITYYVVIALLLVLGMAVAADLLVRIAAPSYNTAAPLIAPVAMGFVAYGFFIAIVRVAQIKHRNLFYGGTAVVCGGLMVVFGLLFIPALGGYGAALAVWSSMTAGSVLFMALIVRGEEPIPFEYARLVGALVLAAGCYGLAIVLAPHAGPAHAALEVAALGVFVAGLVASDIVPARHVRLLGRIARNTLLGGPSRRHLASAVRDLPPPHRSALTAVMRDRLPPDRAADRAGLEPDELCARLVQGLRRVSGHEATETGLDAAIGSYLLSSEPPAERDAIARDLWGRGVDPLELHELESTYQRLAKTSRRSWVAIDAPAT